MSMYYTEETPKRCPKCGDTASKVTQSYEVAYPKDNTRRKRICQNCNNVYFTLTPIDRRFI